MGWVFQGLLRISLRRAQTRAPLFEDLRAKEVGEEPRREYIGGVGQGERVFPDASRITVTIGCGHVDVLRLNEGSWRFWELGFRMHIS